MMRYIPGFISYHYKCNVLKGKFKGFAFLFDIADFTPITIHFNKHGKQGAEELRAFLDFAFGEPVRIVESHGGFVTLFAGDAFCAVFPDSKDKNPELSEAIDQGYCANNTERIMKNRVLNASFRIKRYFMDKCVYQCSLGEMRVKIRQTVSYGEINWHIFKNDLQNEYVFYGKPLKDLAELSKLKEDLVFSRDAAEQIGIKSFNKIKKDGYKYSKLQSFLEGETIDKEEPCKEYPPSISGFLNPKYENVFPQSEIRSASFCFANLSKIAFKDREKAIIHIQILADKYGGYISRYDATDKGMIALILFGMPISEERILERICRFAIEAIAKVPLLAIGLAKGNVYAGYTGSGDIKEYTALGTAVNLAARLMGKAEAGEILTDSNFYRELMDKFHFEETGSMLLKGIKEPVISYRLNKTLIGRRIRRETSFTGRDELLSELKKSIIEALSKNQNVEICVYGNAGTGKSRLSIELMEHFPQNKFNRFFLYCDSVVQRPFEPIKQIIYQYFFIDPEKAQKAGIKNFRARWRLFAGKDEELSRIESIIASIIGFYWNRSVWSMLPPSEKPKQQKNAFLYFMAEIASKKPVIIHLDDGQWIDEESREYFQELSSSEICPVQIIFSSRYLDDGSKPDLDLKNHIKIEKDLGILDDHNSREMIRHILKLNKIPQKTFREINLRAMGNPFFIEQLCAYLKEIEKIDTQGRIIGEIGPLASFQISDIIGSRIDRLAENVRECIYNASVLGMEFNVNILSEMLKRPLDTDLESGKSNMIWKDLQELHYIFSHVLIKDTAYLRIMYNKLKNLHHLAAESMEIIYKRSVDIYAQEIALHYERADILDKSAYYYDRAGCCFRDKYNFSKGQLFLKRALRIRKNLFGRDDPDTAHSMHNLGILYDLLGQYKKAEPLYKRSLQIREKALGKDHPDVADSINSLANMYLSYGRYEEAEQLYIRSLEIREKVLGKDHPDTAGSICNLANFYLMNGKYSEAEPLHRLALEIRKKVLPKDHTDLAKSLNGLAILNWNYGKYEEAEPLYRRSLQIFEKALGKDHPIISNSLNNLACLFNNRGKFKEAEAFYQRSLEIREKVLGKDHPSVAFSLGNLAVLYDEQGKYDKAEVLYLHSLQIAEKALGKEHPFQAETLTNLAFLHYDQGKFKEAENLFLSALSIFEKALGKDHPNIASPLNGLANLYCKQGKYPKAEPLYSRACRIAESALGSDHSASLEYKKNLKECRKAMKNDSK